MVKTPKCPQCDSTEKVRRIVYGFVTKEWCKENPHLIPGGCTLGESNWGCGKCEIRWQDHTMFEVEHSGDETLLDKDETFLGRIEKWLFHKNQVVAIVSFVIVAPVFLLMVALFYIYFETRIFIEDR